MKYLFIGGPLHLQRRVVAHPVDVIMAAVPMLPGPPVDIKVDHSDYARYQRVNLRHYGNVEHTVYTHGHAWHPEMIFAILLETVGQTK